MKIDPMKVLPLDRLELNEGQLFWLRKNPRSWTKTDIDRTKRSLEEDPELMQARPILAIPGEGDKLVVFGGNLRLTAARALGWPGAPVVVFHPDASQIDREAIHRIALKDNGSFGSWDTDELASWDVEPLQLEEWGVPEWITGGAGGGAGSAPGAPEQYGTEFSLQDGEKAPFQQMTFTLADEQAQMVKEALDEAKKDEYYKCQLTYGNENGNGNALSLIIEQWLEQRK